MIWNSARSGFSLLLVGIALVIASVAAGTAQTPESATPEPGAIVREVLSSGEPVSAPGQVLELVRYTIPPDLTLAVHIHPGMQTAMIESGTLHYTVLEGTVPLYRAADPDTLVPVTSADGEITIEPGDSFSEPEGVMHFGRNAGPEPVVILVASLFVTGEPAAIPVTLVATPEP